MLGVVGSPASRTVGETAKDISEESEKIAQQILKENETTAVGYNFLNLTRIVANEAK